MHKFAAWFTTDRRQKIQVFAGSLAPLLILWGFATQGVTEQLLIILGAVLQFLTSITSLANVKRGDWSSAYDVLRTAVYGLAAVASPALVLLGLYSEATNASILTGLSLGLAAFSSLLAIFVSGKQNTPVPVLYRA